MPYVIDPLKKNLISPTFNELYAPIDSILEHTPPLEARGDRPLQMSFAHQLKSLVLFHLEEYESGRHLLQVLKGDDFARNEIAPPQGIKKSSYFEALNNRGLDQLMYVYHKLQPYAAHVLPTLHPDLGKLVAIDGSLIDAVLSMLWADYREGSKKAKVHMGFDINHSIPSKIFLTDGKEGERPYAGQIIDNGQTGVLDRGYQCHENFDHWQLEGKHFVCRIKESTKKVIIESNPIKENSIVFFDAIVLLGTPNVNQTEELLRLVGYNADGNEYWVATDRYDLSAEDIAYVYKLRWSIENFFAWWKKHLKVYHLIARSKYGLMVQMLAGLITYLLISIYCHNNFNEKVSIKRVRELRIRITNELRYPNTYILPVQNNISNDHGIDYAYAKT